LVVHGSKDTDRGPRLRCISAVAVVAERGLVDDAFDCNTFCAEMFATGAAETSMLLTRNGAAFFADGPGRLAA
jgi:hypothetical protein